MGGAEVEQLRLQIERQHACHASFAYERSISLPRSGPGEPVQVLVYDLTGHPKSKKAYGLMRVNEDGGASPFVVLHAFPVLSPKDAAKAAYAPLPTG